MARYLPRVGVWHSLVIALAVSGLATVTALAQDADAEAVLKAKGLTRFGSQWLLPAEAELRRVVVEITEQRAAAETALRSRPTEDAAYQRCRELCLKYIRSVGDARYSADAATKKYGELAADTAVATALKRREGWRLGPSVQFRKFVEAIAEAEANLGGIRKPLETLETRFKFEYVKLERREGVLMVPVTIDGRDKVLMEFSTGSSLVILPDAVARGAGLRIPAEAPLEQFVLLDGRTTITGRRVTVQSLAVGSFRSREGFEVVVLTPDVPQQNGQLGMSFLRTFKCDLDPVKGELKISKAARDEAGDLPVPPPPGAAPEAGEALELPEGPPEAILDAAGLVKAGAFWVLPTENDLTARLRALADQREETLRLARKLDDSIKSELRDEDEYNRLREQIERYLETLAEARALQEAARARYATLAGEPRIKAAIAALKARLGPSPTFGKARVKVSGIDKTVTPTDFENDPAVELRGKLAKAKAAFRYEVIPLTFDEEGEGLAVDAAVTVNGQRKALKMELGTANSLVILPAAIAAELGLRIPADTEVRRFGLGDGRQVFEARIVTLPVTVGGFQVARCEVAIFPEHLVRTRPTLGNSFLNLHRYDIDPANLQLRLRRAMSGERVVDN